MNGEGLRICMVWKTIYFVGYRYNSDVCTGISIRIIGVRIKESPAALNDCGFRGMAQLRNRKIYQSTEQ